MVDKMENKEKKQKPPAQTKQDKNKPKSKTQKKEEQAAHKAKKGLTVLYFVINFFEMYLIKKENTYLNT